MDRQESAAAHRQVLRLRRAVVRAAAEDFTAAWPSRQSWLSRFAQKANGPAARWFGYNTYVRIGRQLNQNTRSPQQGRENDFLEPLQRSRTALHLRLKNCALERGVQKMSEFIAVDGGRQVAGRNGRLQAVDNRLLDLGKDLDQA